MPDPSARDANASPDPFPFDKGEPGSKVSNRLRHLVRRVAARGASRSAILASHPSVLTSALHSVSDNGTIQCYVEYRDEPAATVAAITTVGGIVELVSTPFGVVQARIPYDQIDTLAADAAVRRIRLPAYRLTRTGSVNSQGDAIHRCDTVRTNFGLTGAGMKIGIISDGINAIALSQASGDIPSTYEALSARADHNLNVGAEGLAMMEIVHDLAPGASLAFSNPSTSAEMVTAIGILDSTFHCNIICDDLGFSDEPYFQDGPITDRIDQAVSNGKIYCSAAGNDAQQNYYEGDYVGVTQTVGGQSMNVHDFNGAADSNMRAYISPNGGYLVVLLQWNDPWGASSNDYDLLLTNSTGSTILTASTENQNGSDYPLEGVEYTNNGSSGVYVYVVVRKVSGVARRLKMVSWGNAWFTEYSVVSGSITGHAAGINVISCGAVPASSPNTIEPFSSHGPVRLDFPSLLYRNKPDICGVDGVSDTANGGFVTPFYGTSAAAPHIAAVCAQIWSSDPAMSNTTVRNLLQNTAVDLGATGYDTTYGYGRADAFNAASDPDNCTRAITLSASPSAGGTVSGGGNYPCNASATVTAVANAGCSFVSWTENNTSVSTSASYTFTVNGNRSLLANFSLLPGAAAPVISPAGGTYTDSVTVALSSSTSGASLTYTTDGSDPTSSSTGYTGPFALTHSGTVKARAFAAGFHDSTVSSATYTINAIFTINTEASPPLGGTTSGDGTYPKGTKVTVRATPAAGFTFVNWTENGSPVSSSGSYSFTIAGDRTLAANFIANLPNYTVTTAAFPDSGGTTTGGGTYISGTTITITASAKAGYRFVRWTENGIEASTSAHYQFVADADRLLTAHFSPTTTPVLAASPEQHTLTIVAAGNPTTAHTYPADLPATVSAPPAPSGEYFLNWTGDAGGSDNPITILMDRDKTIIAEYAPCPTPSPPCGAGTPVCGLATALMLGFTKLRKHSARFARNPSFGTADEHR